MELSDLNILYVEDEPNQQNEIKYILEEYVNSVYTASNGKEGYITFKKLKKDGIRVDMLITDIIMPNMDGLKLIKHVQRIYSKIPCIVVSAFSNKEDIYRAIKLNILGFVEKPMDFMQLINIIKLGLEVTNENQKIFKILEKHVNKDKVLLDDTDKQELNVLIEELDEFSNSLLYYDASDKDSYKKYFTEFKNLAIACNNTFYLYINEEAKKYILQFSVAINKLYQFLYDTDIENYCVLNINELLDIIISITDDIVGYISLILKENYFVDSNYFIDSFLSDIQYLKMFFIQEQVKSGDIDFF
jgi:YesN/AraC family two-component response regulator